MKVQTNNDDIAPLRKVKQPRPAIMHPLNEMLGHAKDDPVRLQAGIDYLARL